MERIQAAIQKAKEQRDSAGTTGGTTGGAAPRPESPSPGRPKPYPREARTRRPAGPAWGELAAFDPDPGLMRRHRIVTYDRTDHSHSTFDMMRTKALRIMREKGWTTLGVTSPTTGCGKTTMLANLAFSFAHQPDTRTVAMDVDLKRPGLGRLLGITAPQSMAAVLGGERDLGANFVRYGDNLAVGTNATSLRGSSELLQNAATATALADLRTQFQPDILLFDLPPMLVADDVLAFIPHLDCVLLVAAAEKSRIDEIDKCEQDLAEHTNVLGVVLNKCRYPGEDYGYY